MALAAERSCAGQLDDIADFWCEFINEEEPVRREAEPTLRRAINSEKTYCEKPTIIYESESSSMNKVNSMTEGIPDPDRDDLLDMPPLRSNKSMSTAADSNDLQDQQQSSKHQHHKSKGFKGGNRKGRNECWGEEPKGKVVISAKLAPAATPLARAEKC